MDDIFVFVMQCEREDQSNEEDGKWYFVQSESEDDAKITMKDYMGPTAMMVHLPNLRDALNLRIWYYLEINQPMPLGFDVLTNKNDVLWWLSEFGAERVII